MWIFFVTLCWCFALIFTRFVHCMWQRKPVQGFSRQEVKSSLLINLLWRHPLARTQFLCKVRDVPLINFKLNFSGCASFIWCLATRSYKILCWQDAVMLVRLSSTLVLLLAFLTAIQSHMLGLRAASLSVLGAAGRAVVTRSRQLNCSYRCPLVLFLIRDWNIIMVSTT